MSRSSMRALTAFAGCALAIAACQNDRASITDPVGAVYNARFSRVATFVPGGSVRQSRVNTATVKPSIRISLSGLEQLESGVYQVFLGIQSSDAAEPTSVVPATGLLRIIQTDTTFVNGDPVPQPDTTVRTGVSSFSEGGPSTRFELVVDSASLRAAGAANTDPTAYNLVFVNIEAAPVATPTASAPTPLWARLRNVSYLTTGANANTRTVPLSFGNFDPDPAEQYVFTASGRGMIGVWDNVLVVDDSALALPPEGYFYATVLTRDIPVNNDSVELAKIDLGPQKAPFPRRDVSLRDADINPDLDPVVLEFPPSILAASERVQVDTLSNGSLSPAQPFRGYREVQVTLEAKAGVAAPSPVVILSATIPEHITREQD